MLREGIYDISNLEYHSGPGISSSGIKELLKSPAHYKSYKETKSEETTEMIRGSLVHALILEPENFNNEFVIGDFAVRRGKEYERIFAENPLKKVITRDEFEEAVKIADSVTEQAKANPLLARLLDGQKEKSFFWIDSNTKVQCKVRPDCIANNGLSLVDIKTTRDASRDFFLKQVVDYGYFISAAYYLQGIQNNVATHGYSSGLSLTPVEFIFIAIETKAPYQVAIYKADEKMIVMGAALVSKALDTLAECISTDTWEGYSKDIVELSLPGWALNKYGILR